MFTSAYFFCAKIDYKETSKLKICFSYVNNQIAFKLFLKVCNDFLLLCFCVKMCFGETSK